MEAHVPVRAAAHVEREAQPRQLEQLERHTLALAAAAGRSHAGVGARAPRAAPRQDVAQVLGAREQRDQLGQGRARPRVQRREEPPRLVGLG